jgi:hypothetical protein
VLARVGRWHYLVNGRGGFMPKQHRKLGVYFSSDQMREAADWLRAIWPEAYLVVDLEGVKWWQQHMGTSFTEHDLERYWHEIMRDELYALYRLKPLDKTPPRLVRRLRTDVLRHHPRLRFEARALQVPDGAEAQLRVHVNGHEVKTLALTDELRSFEVLMPRRAMGNIYGEEVSLTLEHVRPDRVEQPETPGLWEVHHLDFALE